MARETQELAQLCQLVGHDVAHVQGGGGNASVKWQEESGTVLAVKASGFRMSEITASGGFVTLDNHAVLEVVRDPLLPAMTTRDANAQALHRINQLGGDGPRPSMETSFHAILGRYILHTHSILANCFTCATHGRAAFEEVWKEPYLWLPYLEPGWVLARAIDDALELATTRPKVILLENHGPIVHGESAEEVAATFQRLLAAAEKVYGALPNDLATKQAPSEALVEASNKLAAAQVGMGVRPASYRWIQQLAFEQPELFTAGNVIPDDAVYMGRAVAVWNPETQPAPEFHHKSVVLVPGVGALLVASAPMADAMDENLLAHVILRHQIGRIDTVRPLSTAEADHIVTMDGEKYRQSLLSPDRAE